MGIYTKYYGELHKNRLCCPTLFAADGLPRTVDDIDDMVARLLAHGAELVGEVVQYEDMYRLAYIRGPEGIIVGLSEQLK